MSSSVFTSIKPTATVLTTVYLVPANNRGTLRIIASNRGSATAIRISVAPGGAADSPEQYVLYDMLLEANGSISLAPLMVSAGTVIRASSASGNVNFHCTGLLQGV